MNQAEIEKRFTYHPPQGNQAERYSYIRDWAKWLALQICNITPESWEQSLAITALEECVMWANAAIARNETTPVTPDLKTQSREEFYANWQQTLDRMQASEGDK